MSRTRERRRRGMSQEQFAANLDLVDCEECGTQFNLAGQSYYGPLCPDCNQEADDQP